MGAGIGLVPVAWEPDVVDRPRRELTPPGPVSPSDVGYGLLQVMFAGVGFVPVCVAWKPNVVEPPEAIEPL